MSAQFVIPREGEKVAIVKCVKQGCGATVYAPTASDRARCNACGTEWAWRNTGRILMKRGHK